MPTQPISTEIKRPTLDHPIDPLLAERWSPRAFAPQAVEPEKLRSLFEAVRWSASSANGQPWRFIVATAAEPEFFARLLACLDEGNQIWARQAPVLMITAAKTTTGSGRPHRLAPYDMGLAAQNLTVQATALGLVVHQMGGFDSAKARAAFSIPEGFEPMTAIALGYVGDPETLPEKNRNQELAPRTRKPLTEFVFGDTWDTPNPLVVASPNPPIN